MAVRTVYMLVCRSGGKLSTLGCRMDWTGRDQPPTLITVSPTSGQLIFFAAAVLGLTPNRKMELWPVAQDSGGTEAICAFW